MSTSSTFQTNEHMPLSIATTSITSASAISTPPVKKPNGFSIDSLINPTSMPSSRTDSHKKTHQTSPSSLLSTVSPSSRSISSNSTGDVNEPKMSSPPTAKNTSNSNNKAKCKESAHNRSLTNSSNSLSCSPPLSSSSSTNSSSSSANPNKHSNTPTNNLQMQLAAQQQAASVAGMFQMPTDLHHHNPNHLMMIPGHPAHQMMMWPPNQMHQMSSPTSNGQSQAQPTQPGSIDPQLSALQFHLQREQTLNILRNGARFFDPRFNMPCKF